MPRVQPIQASFAGGELSPRLRVRSDLAAYAKGCQTMRGFLPLPQGPADRRRGTQHLGAVKDETKTVRLVPFVVREDQAYVLELGHQYGRIWRQDGTQVTASPQLITNGTFDTGLTGWTDASTGGGSSTWDAATASLRLTAGAGQVAARRQSVTITATGQPHTLHLRSFGAFGVTLRIGTTAGGQEVLADTFYGSGTHTVPLTPAVSPIWIELRKVGTPLNAGMDAQVDDVSMLDASTAPLDVVTPYAEADLAGLQWAQSADVLYATQVNHALRKVRRFAETDWDLTTVAFTVPPTQEYGRTPAATLTPAATTGLGVTFTAGASVFVASDVGRQIVAKPGRAVLVSQTGTACVADITEAFRSTAAISSGAWSLDASPQTTLTPSVAGPAGVAVTLAAAAASGAFAAGDVGKWVSLNDGVVEVTAFTDPQTVQGRVRVALSGITAAAAGAWSIEEPVASASRGYFHAVCFHEGRLCLGHGYIVYASQSDDFEHHHRGATAEKALVIPLTSGQVNTIRCLASGPRDLLAGTTGPGFKVSADAGPLAPDNLGVRRAWKESAAAAMPVIIDPAVLLLESGGHKVLGVAFNFDQDSYEVPDLLLLSEHLGAQGFVEVVFTARPEPTLWARDTAGGLFACRYLPEQEVLAWAPQPIGGNGAVEALAAVPKGDGSADVLFLAVRRTINGATHRYVERLDPTADLYVDSAVQVTGTNLTSVSGLGHLEGQTVQVRGDGATLPEAVVTGGVVALPPTQPCSTVQVGLFADNALTPFSPEGGNPAGTALGRTKRFAEVLVWVRETRGGEVNGHQYPVRAPDDDMDTAPPPTTGILRISNPEGWSREATNTIRQPGPQPMTVLGISGVLVVEG